ncbi:MAG TPA: biotin/lipoyl-containing protein, partial [Acidimicrobiales bacterium]
VAPEFDSLLGKVIAWGPDRNTAVRRLSRGLDGLEIHGVATNREMLRAVTREGDFLAGRVTTSYLADHPEVLERAPLTTTHVVSAALWAQAHRRAGATLPSGFRNLRSQDQVTAWQVGDDILEVTYAVEGDRYRASVGGRAHAGRVVEIGDEVVDVEEDGLRTRCLLYRGPESVLVVSPGAQTVCREVPRFTEPGAAEGGGAGPAAPVPGTVVRVEVSAGEAVTAGQTLVVLEAMKLEHRIRAEADAVVAEVLVAAGDKVDAHQALIRLEGG